jgi:hypothetical protein
MQLAAEGIGGRYALVCARERDNALYALAQLTIH